MDYAPLTVRFRPPKAYFITVGYIEGNYPRSLDHFRIYHNAFDSAGKHIRALEIEQDLVRKGYGRFVNNDENLPRLERVPITLMYSDITLNLNSYLALYGSSTCWCRCADYSLQGDNKAVRKVPEVKGGKKIPSGKVIDVDCPCELYGKSCQEYTRLYCQIEGWERYGAHSILRTKSYHTRNSIASSLYMLHTQLRGHIAGIHLELTVEMHKREGKQFPVISLCAPAHGKTLLELYEEAVRIPAIDQDPEAAKAIAGFLVDRKLDIAEHSEIHAIKGLIEPPSGDDAIDADYSIEGEARDDEPESEPDLCYPSDDEKEALRRKLCEEEGINPDTGEKEERLF